MQKSVPHIIMLSIMSLSIVWIPLYRSDRYYRFLFINRCKMTGMESQYNSDNSQPNPDPLAVILAEMSSKLEGIGRLEKKLEEATANFSGEMDIIKTELGNLTEARKSDKIELTKLQASVTAVAKDLARNEEIQSNIERKVDKIDNTSNKNLERISKLEQSNAKLSEEMRLL